MNPSIKVETSKSTPNFLESEQGLVLKTRQIPQAMGVEDGNYKTVSAGTPFPANDETAVGLVFTDTDVTDGDAIGSVLVEGRVLKDRVEVSDEAVEAMFARGIKFVNEDGDVIVPAGGGDDPLHDVIIEAVDHGSVSPDPVSAARGTVVTLTATPAEGYKLDTVTVLSESGASIETTEVSANVRKFTMPSTGVFVTPAFVLDE